MASALAATTDGTGDGDESIEHDVDIQRIVSIASIDPVGFVTCPVSPFSGVRPPRITSWPAEKAEIDRSISMHCTLHGSKCSATVRARKLGPIVNKTVLIEWFSEAGWL